MSALRSAAGVDVVVGGGHNGLVAACYLAKAGLDVEVVERRDVVGGAVSTVERFPGYRMDVGSSAHIMVRHTGIVEDLDLAACGLEYQDLDPWGFAPFGDEALLFSVDLAATCDSIAAVDGSGRLEHREPREELLGVPARRRRAPDDVAVGGTAVGERGEGG